MGDATRRGRMFVGTSGWRYAGWRGDFYPRGLRQRDELAYLAERMSSVEINGSFYSLQRPSSYAAWREATPAGFVFAVKGGRYITHLRRLVGIETALANFFASGQLALGDRLGPVLWQLPERVAFDAVVLDSFLAQLPPTVAAVETLAARHDDKLAGDRVLLTRGAGVAPGIRVRHALEARHVSFDSDAARAVLRRHGVALVLADSAGRWPAMGGGTADFHYVRLHGEQRLYAGGYGDATLDRLAGLAEEWAGKGEDVYAYFDNDIDGRAPYDAMRLIDRIGGTTRALG